MPKGDVAKRKRPPGTIVGSPGNKKFSADSQQLMLDLAAKGATNTILAAAVGVHVDTLQGWIKRGRDELAEVDPSAEFDLETLSEWGQWVFKLEKGRAELAANLSGKVVEAAMSGAPNTWQAAMTFLERRYPHEWGKRETRVHEGNGDSPLPPINILVLNDPDARTAHRDLLRSVDAANRSRARVSVGTGVGGELEAGSQDSGDDLDLGSR